MKLSEENKKNIALYKETKEDKYKEKIINDNRRLSLLIFNKYKEMYKINSSISLADLKDDLVQEGDLALSIAIDEYDPKKRIEFSTYAYTVIENAFYNYFAKNKNLIRLPKRTELLISKVKDTIKAYKEINKIYPTSEEIVSFLNDGTTKEQVDNIIPFISSKGNKVVNLSDLSKNSTINQESYSNFFISEYDTPLEAYQKKEKKELIDKAIENLPIKLKNVFIDYYLNHYTFKQLSKKYSLTIEGVRQIYVSAIKKINNYIKSTR